MWSSIRRIGVFATAGSPDAGLLAEGVRVLREGGFQVSVSLPEGGPFRGMAGTDEARLRAFHGLLADPGNDLLLAASGGYGTARLLDRIDWQAMRARNLPVVGHSDVTALHLAALGQGCCRHVQGPMLCRQWGDPERRADLAENLSSLGGCLAGTPELLPAWHGAAGLQDGRCTGRLVPANLATLTGLAGTPWFPDLAGAVLVVEDTHEAAHRIDRMLNQLRQMGVLPGLGGLVFGQFTDCEDGDRLPGILREYAGLVHGPAAWGLRFGHAARSLSLPVGREVEFTVDGGDVSLKLTRKELYRPHVFGNPFIQMPYRLLEPESPAAGERYPLVLLFHGAGERGIDNFRQLVHVAEVFTRPGNRRRFPCYVCCPQCREGRRWVETPWDAPAHVLPADPSPDLAAALALLDELCRRYPVDTGRIYLMGLSMGGFAVWDCLCRAPGRFAAAAAMCGGGDPACAGSLTGVPIWAFHGAADGAVSPERSRRMVQAIRQAGGTLVRHTEYPGVGHACWTPAANEPELLPWLFGHAGNH